METHDEQHTYVRPCREDSTLGFLFGFCISRRLWRVGEMCNILVLKGGRFLEEDEGGKGMKSCGEGVGGKGGEVKHFAGEGVRKI